jgi:hypothetical protein
MLCATLQLFDQMQPFDERGMLWPVHQTVQAIHSLVRSSIHSLIRFSMLMPLWGQWGCVAPLFQIRLDFGTGS